MGRRRKRQLQIPTTLLTNVHHQGRLVCDHVWIDGHLPEKFCEKTISFFAEICTYRRGTGEKDYTLYQIENIGLVFNCRKKLKAGQENL